MKRTLVAVALVAAAWPGRAEPAAGPTLTGLWNMRETDSRFEGCLRRTWLEIHQEGDLALIRAWEEYDTWRCEGRGRVRDGRLHFDWRGADKRWRGTADLAWDGRELKGTFQRLDVHADAQYCAGGRE